MPRDASVIELNTRRPLRPVGTLMTVSYQEGVFALEGRPTGSFLVWTDAGLVVVLPKRATSAEAYIFPQGGMRLGENLLRTALRELWEECKFGPNFFSSDCYFLGDYFSPEKSKHLLGVMLCMHELPVPILNGENRGWEIAEDYPSLLKRVRGCTQDKKLAILKFLEAASCMDTPLARQWGPVPREFKKVLLGVR